MPPSTAMAPTRTTTTQPTTNGLLQPPPPWGMGRGAGLNGEACWGGGGGGGWGGGGRGGGGGGLVVPSAPRVPVFFWAGPLFTPPRPTPKTPGRANPPPPAYNAAMEYEPLPSRPSRYDSAEPPQG